MIGIFAVIIVLWIKIMHSDLQINKWKYCIKI